MSDRKRERARTRVAQPEEAAPMDPVALTLALWLGLVAGVTGLVRMSENVAVQAQMEAQTQMQQRAMAAAQQQP